jgi:HSP20 family protein
MKLVRWNPFLDDGSDFGMLSPFVGSNAFVPSLDIYQDKDNVMAKVALPGIDPENVNISIENDILTIEGSVKKESEVDEKDYYRKEISSGSFHRSMILPTSVDGNKAKAEFANGILEITMPKKEEVKPKTIKVEIKK